MVAKADIRLANSFFPHFGQSGFLTVFTREEKKLKMTLHVSQ
jgi:hypothetical protein